MSHLGGHGYVTHMDVGSALFMKELGVTSVVDVGCGCGGQSSIFQQIGFDVYPIDGDNVSRKCVKLMKLKRFIFHDFNDGCVDATIKADAAWCVEFLEHINEKYLENVFASIDVDHVFCTAAPPGKGGHHHVNCRDHQYWIDVFDSYGYVYSNSLTADFKAASTMTREFIRNDGMVYVKRQVCE